MQAPALDLGGFGWSSCGRVLRVKEFPKALSHSLLVSCRLLNPNKSGICLTELKGLPSPSFIYLLKKIFMYLFIWVAPGLSCRVRDL